MRRIARFPLWVRLPIQALLFAITFTALSVLSSDDDFRLTRILALSALYLGVSVVFLAIERFWRRRLGPR
jgi:amino acid permease